MTVSSSKLQTEQSEVYYVCENILESIVIMHDFPNIIKG